MLSLNTYEKTLLEGWEDTAKKGHLTLWILLALKDGSKHMAVVKTFITTATNGLLEADDKSMYRALRRYYDAEMVDYKSVESENGPKLKQYYLTPSGRKVLDEFVKRNIVDVYFKPPIKRLLNS